MTKKQPDTFVKTASVYTTGRHPDAAYVADGIVEVINNYFGDQAVSVTPAEALAWGKHEDPAISLDKLFKITVELVENPQ